MKKPLIVVHDDMSVGALEGAVIGIGNFDGVHRGDREVIAVVCARARALGRPAAVLTFEPHPDGSPQSDEPLFRLSDATNTLRLLAATELDGAIVMTGAPAELSLEAFVERVLVQRCHVSGAVIAGDFRFGKDRSGSSDLLVAQAARHGFSADIVPPAEHRGHPVSSGAIRDALEQGRVEEAAELLGYPWLITGTVVSGDKRGRELGYPTANLQLDPSCRLKHGGYAVRVGLGSRRYDAVASFGRRPTFDNGSVLLEVFLFDFSGDLYGQVMDVAFLARLGDEVRYARIEDLLRRMDDDCRKAREILKRAGDTFPSLGRIEE